MASLRTALRLAPRAQYLRRTPVSLRAPFARQRHASSMTPRPADDQKSASQIEEGSEDLDDPRMTGGYVNPDDTAALPLKRQHRDPYGDWWDPIEKRNYGEPVHEDNDILGVFSPDEYTHFTPGWGAILFGTFVASVGVLCAVVYQTYPDLPAVSRTFEGGLETELGGPLARAARKTDDEPGPLDRTVV